MRIPQSVKRLLRPELLVTGFCFLLPDLVDKPLWVLGAIPDGRFIGHTLLAVSLVAVAFFIKNRVYGLFALCGGMLHLLTDTGNLVPWLLRLRVLRGYGLPHIDLDGIPWFYPFKSYDIPQIDYHRHVTLDNIIQLAAETAVVMVAGFLILSFALWLRDRYERTSCRISKANEIAGLKE